MEIGIIGLPRSGKTTLFNALTKGNVSVASYGHKSNVGVVKVPDQRLDALARMYNPQRTVPAEVFYTDVPPPPEGFGKTRGIGGEYLNALQSADALLIVVREFQDPSVAHIDETIDPVRDAENMVMEMTFSDLEVLSRRLERIDTSFKGAREHQREALRHEQNLINRIKAQLDSGISLRDQMLSPEEIKLTAGFGFLSIKPIIIVINIGEEGIATSEHTERSIAGSLSGKEIRTAAICAQLEMDLVQMAPAEEQQFRDDLGVGESSLTRMVRLSHDVTNQISFFTVGEDEVRAWQVQFGTNAQKASGKIHTDLERGFIRAEVISSEDLLRFGGLAAAKKQGTVRQEGKSYIVKDGDIMHVLFNI